MPLVQIPVGVRPIQIDDFPEKVVEGKDALLERHKKAPPAEEKPEARAKRLERQRNEVAELDKKARPFKRSCKGSLHLRPASTKTLTDDELGFLRTAKQHKAWGRRLLEVKVEVAKAPEAAPVVPPLPKPEPEEVPAPDAEEAPEGSSRRRRGRSG